MANYGYMPRMYQPLSRTQAAIQGIGQTISDLANQSTARKQMDLRHRMGLAQIGLQGAQIEAEHDLGKQRTIRDIANIKRQTEKDTADRERQKKTDEFERLQNTYLPFKDLHAAHNKFMGIPDEETQRQAEMIPPELYNDPRLMTLKGMGEAFQKADEKAKQERLEKFNERKQTETERHNLETEKRLASKGAGDATDQLKRYEDARTKRTTYSTQLYNLEKGKSATSELMTLLASTSPTLANNMKTVKPGETIPQDVYEQAVRELKTQIAYYDGIAKTYEKEQSLAKRIEYMNNLPQETINGLNALPNNQKQEGMIATDNETGDVYIMENGKWLPK